MKKTIFLCFLVFACSVLNIFAQGIQPSPTPTRPRVIVVGNSPTPTPVPSPKVIVVTNNLPTPSPTPVYTPKPTPSPTPYVTATSSPTPVFSTSYPISQTMSFGQLKNKIAEAKQLMQTRPIPTAITDSFMATDVLRVAFYDWKTRQIDFVVLTKTIFLAKGMQFPTVSTNGKSITVRILRANGVNTPIMITDNNDNQFYTPLVAQYPIERDGALAEVAYYTSTHPGVVNPEIVSAGKLYVHNTIEIARTKLQEKGLYISPQVADIAERLATVEHVDHPRFWNESQPSLYNEIFTLYALNEGNTYRYSVSRAGAGGMVQMIPSTYFMIRSRYYNVGLIPDFVDGMRNHVNACQAMLLYMQMTWNDLSANETIANALMSGTATQAELMAAGYNSNPARLPIYIKRGGSNWKTLIPKETKIYLQIYSSLEAAVPMSPRGK
ncbi:MAG: hypothetical protein K1X72_22590 [Pyrinomonadaceae bacterium]|nr:hypothetical protein [Pyrinomonadaceae bacterium]